MIVHSATNELDGTCLVQVEGIEPNMSETIVCLFAQGAAGRHNKGHLVYASRVTEWLDENGRPITAGFDTSEATGARVLCAVEAP